MLSFFSFEGPAKVSLHALLQETVPGRGLEHSPRWNDAVREQDRAASGTALGPDHREAKEQVFAERAGGRGKNLPGRRCLHPLASRPVSLPFPCPGGG